MHTKWISALLALVAVSGFACAQETTRAARKVREPGRVVAKVGAVKGKGASAERAGEKRALVRGADVLTGDVVSTKRSAIELALLEEQGAPRVALGRKSRVHVAPLDEDVDLVLDEGSLLALGDEAPVKIRAGRNVVIAEKGAQVELELSAGGDLEVSVYLGFVCVVVGAEKPVRVHPGKRVRVSGGRIGRPKPVRRGGPKLATALDLPIDVIWRESFLRRGSDYTQVIGVLASDGFMRGVRGGGAYARSVLLFKEPQGLFVTRPGARLRVRYRLFGVPSRLVFKLYPAGKREEVGMYKVQLPLEQPEWGEVDVDLATLLNNKTRKPLGSGARIQGVAFKGGRSGEVFELEVDEILVYVPGR